MESVALAAEVADLVREAGAADGVAAIGESALLALRHLDRGGSTVRVALESGRIVAVAVCDPTPDRPGSVDIELVVHPAYRRRGVGRRLLSELPDAKVRQAWAHGDLPAARHFAAALGFRPIRTLHRLRRSLAEPLPEVDVPDGVRVRPYRVGADDEDWVRVNASAFAHHPEQGAMTLADLQDRQAEPWFSAAGFLVAEATEPVGGLQPGAMAGYHWTKVHDAGTSDAIGEVYVVGVDPAAQGLHLGRALTLAGLHHLRDLDLDAVMLYVDDDNTPAMRLYERLGFAPWTDDVQYSDSAT